MKKRILALLLILCLCLSLSIPAWASDNEGSDPYINYSGDVDPVTGNPSGTGGSEDIVPTSGVVDITNTLAYNYNIHAYLIPANGGMIQSSIPSGFVTTDSVKIQLQGGITGQLYLDGNEIANGTSFEATDVGGYVLSIPTIGSQSIEPMRFFIVSELNSGLNYYSLPDGFVFSEVLCDGDEAAYESNYLSLNQEGTYLIKVGCPSTGVSHTLTLRIDHTAPVLALANVVDGVADGPVDISDLEPGAAIRIELDGSVIDYEPELTASGDYYIIVQDEAGNRREYNFTIATYFNGSAWIFLLLLAAVISGLVIYLVIARKKLRIR